MDKRDPALKKSEAVPKRGIAEIAVEKCSKSEISLERLVDQIQSELGYDRDRILAKLTQLSEEKKIELVEVKPYESLVSYVLSPYSLWFWGALFSTLFSVALISVTNGIALYLRYVFGGLLVLFLPSYSLIELLYAKRRELNDLTRIALSIGLSLALVPLTGART